MRFSVYVLLAVGVLFASTGCKTVSEPLSAPQSRTGDVLTDGIIEAEEKLAFTEKSLGPDHPDVAKRLDDLSFYYTMQGRLREVNLLFRRSLKIREKALGPDHPDLVKNLDDISGIHIFHGRYADAEALLRRSLAIMEKAHGPEHLNVLERYNSLAHFFTSRGRYPDAERLYRHVLAIREKAPAPEWHVSLALERLAGLFYEWGRYADAEQLYQRSLGIRKKVRGPKSRDVAESLEKLAEVYLAHGRYQESDSLHERSLGIYSEVENGRFRVADSLFDWADQNLKKGRYAEAESLYRRSLAIYEKAFGPKNTKVPKILERLANLYHAQGRYAEAEPLYQRVLLIREENLSFRSQILFNHTDVATALNNIAELYRAQGRYAEAEPLYKRALGIWEKTFGVENKNVAAILNNLASLYTAKGLYGEAESLYKRAIGIQEKAFGPDHPDTALTLNNIASLYLTQRRYLDAEPLYKRWLEISEKVVGPVHPNVAMGLGNMAALYVLQGRHREALGLSRRASNIFRTRALISAGHPSAGGKSEQRKVRQIFLAHVASIRRVAGTETNQRAALIAEDFEVGQLARTTSVGEAVAGMGTRFGSADDTLSIIVRVRQDALEEWRRLDKKLIDIAGLPPKKRKKEAEEQLRTDLAELDVYLRNLDARLSAEFPEYSELVSPQPVPLVEAQKLLGVGEALISFAVADDATFMWLVRKEVAGVYTLDIGKEELGEAVAKLRDGLDPADIESLADIPTFDSTLAFELYNKIFSPVEEHLKDVRHILVVPDGALQSLPLGVLVAEKPNGSLNGFEDYMQVPWLAKKYALTTLPSVSSLRALRHFAKASRASRSFVGVGDPVLEGDPGKRRSVKLAQLFKARGIANVDMVRTKLSPLPETSDELKTIAEALGAGEGSLYLRNEATETRIKEAELSDVRVIAFATHGLVAGDLAGLAEPALVLTPPTNGTEQDDGLLTASEVAHLKLDADLVVLSACNTAAADGRPEADAFSGLAKAFFYAGSRSLLVSHWPVVSGAAAKLTTGMLSEAADDNEIGRSEALRRSMLKLINDPEEPHYAHPMFWAPFVVVGEGGKVNKMISQGQN
jgi:CHAT domain-containing protein/tetratricopeptide (TPR) repeat protein